MNDFILKIKYNKRLDFRRKWESPLNILFYRYYYKQNIFGIVENKRLVYRFGSKAKDWKPVGKSLKTHAAPPERRCYNCLRLLESGASLKVKEHNIKMCHFNFDWPFPLIYFVSNH